MKGMSFVTSVDKFVENKTDTLTDEHLPAIVSLYHMAEDLDNNGVTGPIVSAFGLAYRNLLKELGHKDDGPVDELEALLTR